MIKPALIAIGIAIVCTLENIGHYFGFCFHGMLSSIIGCISVGLMGTVLYFKQFQIWLNSRSKDKQPHRCKDHDHAHTHEPNVDHHKQEFIEAYKEEIQK